MKDDLGLSARTAHRKEKAEKILRLLDSLNETPQQLLARIDMDFLWFQIWTGALGIGGRCPSHEVRALVREAVRVRLPELHVLSADDRKLLDEMERARNSACGEQWREPDLDTAEDQYDR